MTDPRQRFSAVASGYDRYRPGYPSAIIDWISDVTGAGPGARAADLGCGTGIWSRALAARGFLVTGVDPNPDMLAQARLAGGGPTYQRGEAAATGLPDGAFELCTAAQAFHWFALEPTLAELARVLVPGGWTCAVWNLRTAGAFTDEYDRLLVDAARDYARFSDDIDPRVPVAAALPAALQTEVPNIERLAWDAVLGRAHSASYVALGVADTDAFDRRLREIFDRHAGSDGAVEWTMRTVAIAWPVRAS